MTQMSLFETLRPPVRHDRPAPAQETSASSVAGARYIEQDDRRHTIVAWIVWLLQQAGRVGYDGTRGGMTVEELAEAITQYRGKLTKETTVYGRIAGTIRPSELDGIVVKSGRKRRSRAGVPVDVYVHCNHA